MAKIVIEMDSVTKEFSATIDGYAIPNVEMVELYKHEEGKGSIVISMGSMDKENGIYINTRIHAKESPEAKRALVLGNAKEVVGFPDFVAIQKRIKKYV